MRQYQSFWRAGSRAGRFPLLTAMIAERVRKVVHTATVTVLHAPPVLGAALLALDIVSPGDREAQERARAALTTRALAGSSVA